MSIQNDQSAGHSFRARSNAPPVGQVGRRLAHFRGVLAISLLAWFGLLLAPVPWILPGTPTGPLPSLGYGAGAIIIFGGIVALLLGLALAASWSRASQALTLTGVFVAAAASPINVWLWALIVIGTFDRTVVLARHHDEYSAMAENCRSALSLPTMAERRRAADVLPKPPDDWMFLDTCNSLAFEVGAFDRNTRCPRFLPRDSCVCGHQQWPEDRPACDRGSVICARVPGDTDESGTRFQCIP